MSGDDIKKGGGKVVEGIINKSKERRMITTTKGTKNVVPIGKKSREYISELGK